MSGDSVQALMAQGEAHAARGEWAAAIASFESVLATRSGDPAALLQLSYVESLRGRYRRAREYALQACGRVPRQPRAATELVARLRTFNEGERLLHFVDALGPPAAVPIPLLLACAAQLSNLNRQQEAAALIEEAARADPRYPPTLLARAQVSMYMGRFDAARADLEACRAKAPEIARTYWLWSNIRKAGQGDNNVDAIERQLRRNGRTPADAVLLAFALHRELDDLGDHPRAWQALETGCGLKRSQLAYEPRQTDSLFEALRAWRPPKGATASPSPLPALPIFIVGMHRSGTTLLEQMLHGLHVEGLGELYDFTSQMRHATDHHCRGVIDHAIVERAATTDLAQVGQGYLQGVRWRLGTKPFFSDKLPSNFLNLGFICAALPSARILHLRRDPIEVCFSNLREPFSDANPYSYVQEELAHFHHQYTGLMAHWHAMFPGRILDLDYRDLVSRPREVLRSVTGFCGMQFEEEMLDVAGRTRAVSTASAVAVRGAVTSAAVPKWKPYEAQLAPLIRALAAEGPGA